MHPPPPSPVDRAGLRRHLGPLVIGLAALVAFGSGLRWEPHFVDESAIIAKSYFLDLVLPGGRDDPAWLSYAAFDHPPLAQYLTGLALRAAGEPFPGRGVFRAWQADTRTRGESDTALVAARWPSAILGALGCIAIAALGMIVGGRKVGVASAVLLAINPLYALHARRAIADVPCQAFLLATLAFGLVAWRDALAGRGSTARLVVMALLAGAAGGLAALAKLNGLLALMSLATWAVLALALPGIAWGRKAKVLTLILLSALSAAATFVALNPTLTARPSRVGPGATGIIERMQVILRHRVGVSARSRDQFPDDALRTAVDKVEAVAVQGFGRFGPLGPKHSDSTRRFDWEQDRGALLWLPWVICGGVWAFLTGRSQVRRGEPPTAWALGAYALLALVTVTAFIPLAWDRYFLDLQPAAALLAAGASVTLVERWRVQARSVVEA